jgi:hypothetical protein
VKATANAVADNAWDAGVPVPKDVADQLVIDLRKCIQFVRQSTEAF